MMTKIIALALIAVLIACALLLVILAMRGEWDALAAVVIGLAALAMAGRRYA
jgi:hypothetical protein